MSVVFEMLLGREFHALIVLGRYEYKHRRTGRGGRGGGSCPPQFGQFVNMNSGRESTLFGQNTIHV